jgi:asparagine synthase (glutamine-hydrolysing)
MKINELPTVAGQGVLADLLDVRHPMMYRPLVELALRLPPDLRARPHAQRWVLRQSMRGILPEAIRTRVGKQDTGETLAYSLMTERARLLELLKDPILADLGVLDAARLRIAFNAATRRFGGANDIHAQLATTLCVEAWLQMRSGGWPAEVISGIRNEQFPQTTNPRHEGNQRRPV